MRSIRRRSLIEQQGTGFTLQNAIMEHVTDRLVADTVRESQNRRLIRFAAERQPQLGTRPTDVVATTSSANLACELIHHGENLERCATTQRVFDKIICPAMSGVGCSDP